MRTAPFATAAILLAISCATAADSACDHPQNNFDGLYCMNKVYLQADKELNEAYGKLAKKLDAGAKKSLKTGQLKWMEDRNGSCSFSDEKGFYVNMQCATDKTVTRVQFLNDRLRECESTGCQTDKL
jgi:uncharacterized protein YecT (DUF1311 family)